MSAWKRVVIGALAAMSLACGRCAMAQDAPAVPLPMGHAFHVTPDGKPTGDGSLTNPWDIQTAMLQPAAVKPGDTIWIHGGTYVPDGKVMVHLQGEKDKPIIARNWNNERVTLNAPVNIAQADDFPTKYCWIWGLEIQTAGTKNAGAPVDIGNSAHEAALNPGIKVINCVAHDCPGNGFGDWGSAEEEVYGCIIYNNGSDGDRKNPAERGHGHGFYIQSKTHKEFINNIVFRQFFLGFQIYGTAAAHFVNVTMQGNTFFNNGEMSLIQKERKEWPAMYIGGGNHVINPKVIDNDVYCPADLVKATSNMGGTENALLEGNYLVSPGADKRVALDLEALSYCGPNKDLVMNNNTFIGMIVGFTIDQYGKGNVHIPDRPTTGTKVFVRPNRYEAGRANITIYNWGKSDTVDVNVKDIGLKEGDAYEIRDVQDFYGKPVVTGTFNGESVTIPMTGTSVAAVIGRSPEYTTPPHTSPEFGALVIMKAAQ